MYWAENNHSLYCSGKSLLLLISTGDFMKKNLTLFFLFVLTLPVLAQEKEFSHDQALQRKNSVVLTLGGNGLFLSLSYDRIIVVRPTYFVDVAAGIGFVPGVAGANLPHQIIINKGKRSSFFMFGVGGTYEWNKTDASAFTETETYYYLSPIAGWKKIFSSHLVFSIYASPVIHIFGSGSCVEYPILPYGGIRLGYSF